MKHEEQEQQEEWEAQLTDNLMNSYRIRDATALVIEGTDVRKQHGLVLISGDYDELTGHKHTEMYDSAREWFTNGPVMKTARSKHASVTLKSGDIAMFGGRSSTNRKYLTSCDVFYPTKWRFSRVRMCMSEKRDRPAAVLLRCGLVLIIGGYDGLKHLRSCEFFDPSTKRFTPSNARMRQGRSLHTASLLPDGKVLVCGGSDGYDSLEGTEIYDPDTDSFSAGPSMLFSRQLHTATTLLDGRVFICGDGIILPGFIGSTEIYNPDTNSFSYGPNTVEERSGHFAALLPDGRVLIGGGRVGNTHRTTEIYDPATDSCKKWYNLMGAYAIGAASSF